MSSDSSYRIVRDLDRAWPDLLATVDEGKRAALEEARVRLVALLRDAGAPAQDIGAQPSLCADILKRVFTILAKEADGRTLSLASGVCREWRREATAPALWLEACRTGDRHEASQAVIKVKDPNVPPVQMDGFSVQQMMKVVIPRARYDAPNHHRAAFLQPDATEEVWKIADGAVVKFARAFGHGDIDVVVISPAGYFRAVFLWDASGRGTQEYLHTAREMFKKVHGWAKELGGVTVDGHDKNTFVQDAPGARAFLKAVRKIAPEVVHVISSLHPPQRFMAQEHLVLLKEILMVAKSISFADWTLGGDVATALLMDAGLVAAVLPLLADPRAVEQILFLLQGLCFGSLEQKWRHDRTLTRVCLDALYRSGEFDAAVERGARGNGNPSLFAFRKFIYDELAIDPLESARMHRRHLTAFQDIVAAHPEFWGPREGHGEGRFWAPLPLNGSPNIKIREDELVNLAQAILEITTHPRPSEGEALRNELVTKALASYLPLLVSPRYRFKDLKAKVIESLTRWIAMCPFETLTPPLEDAPPHLLAALASHVSGSYVSSLVSWAAIGTDEGWSAEFAERFNACSVRVGSFWEWARARVGAGDPDAAFCMDAAILAAEHGGLLYAFSPLFAFDDPEAIGRPRPWRWAEYAQRVALVVQRTGLPISERDPMRFATLSDERYILETLLVFPPGDRARAVLDQDVETLAARATACMLGGFCSSSLGGDIPRRLERMLLRGLEHGPAAAGDSDVSPPVFTRALLLEKLAGAGMLEALLHVRLGSGVISIGHHVLEELCAWARRENPSAIAALLPYPLLLRVLSVECEGLAEQMTCRVGFQNNYGALCVVSALLQAVAIARWAGAERHSARPRKAAHEGAAGAQAAPGALPSGGEGFGAGDPNPALTPENRTPAEEPNFAGVGGVGGGGSEGSWSSSGGGSRTSTSSQGSRTHHRASSISRLVDRWVQRKLGPLMRDMHTFFENLRFFQGFLLDEMLEMHAGEVRDVTHANGYSAMYVRLQQGEAGGLVQGLLDAALYLSETTGTEIPAHLLAERLSEAAGRKEAVREAWGPRATVLPQRPGQRPAPRRRVAAE